MIKNHTTYIDFFEYEYYHGERIEYFSDTNLTNIIRKKQQYG